MFELEAIYNINLKGQWKNVEASCIFFPVCDFIHAIFKSTGSRTAISYKKHIMFLWITLPAKVIIWKIILIGRLRLLENTEW